MKKPKSNPVILDKPESKDKCYVTVRDGRTKKSKGLTVYDIRPDQLIELIRKAIQDGTPANADAA